MEGGDRGPRAIVPCKNGSCLDSVKFRSRDEYSEVDPVRRNGTDMVPLYAIREYFCERILERIYFDDVRVVDVPILPCRSPMGGDPYLV